MLKLITSLATDIRKNVGKTILTLSTVALGVGILTVSLSLSGWLKGTVTDSLEKGGLVLNYANAEWSDSGELERVMPPDLSKEIISVLKSDLEGIVAAAPVFNGIWSEINLNGKKYQLRNIIGTTEEYREVMDLEIIAGSFFTAQDVEIGAKKAVISESLAEQLFGSPEGALGQSFQPPAGKFRRQGGEESTIIDTFALTGVFRDPDELLRQSYQIADMAVPFTSVLPGGSNAGRTTDMIYGKGVVRLEGYGFEKAESLIRDTVSLQYGANVALAVWEGSLNGDSSFLTQARETVSTFTIVVNLLGMVLLLTGTIGILSIMMIEALGRTREIALERAIGASRTRVLGEFLGRSLMLTTVSILLGTLMALLLLRPLSSLLEPVFSSLGLGNISPGLTPGAFFTAALAALAAGGILGMIPVVSLMRGSISDTIREG